MKFLQMNEGPCRTYFIGADESRDAAIVDPLIARVDDYLQFAKDGGWNVRYAIDTHTHADHVSGARLLQERGDVEVLMHKKAAAKFPTARMTDGSDVRLGDGELRIQAIETPGHTRDSISLLAGGKLMTGDWLFIGGAGRTDLPGGNSGEHWDSLSRVIPTLDEQTTIHPGHDYQDKHESVLAHEKKTNVNLEPRSRDDYVRWLAAMTQPTPPWMIETVKANNEGSLDPSADFMPEGAESACMCQPAPAGAIPSISVTEVHALGDERHQALLLDVREPDEYVGPLGHVPGATLIPLGQLGSRLDELEAHRDQTVIAICKSGGRSARATALLLDAGFTRVLNMTGGTLAWRAAGYDTDRNA